MRRTEMEMFTTRSPEGVHEIDVDQKSLEGWEGIGHA